MLQKFIPKSLIDSVEPKKAIIDALQKSEVSSEKQKVIFSILNVAIPDYLAHTVEDSAVVWDEEASLRAHGNLILGELAQVITESLSRGEDCKPDRAQFRDLFKKMQEAKLEIPVEIQEFFKTLENFEKACEFLDECVEKMSEKARAVPPAAAAAASTEESTAKVKRIGFFLKSRAGSTSTAELNLAEKVDHSLKVKKEI